MNTKFKSAIILGLGAILLIAAASKTVHEFTNKPNIATTDMFLLDSGTANFNITYGQLKSNVFLGSNVYVGSFTGNGGALTNLTASAQVWTNDTINIKPVPASAIWFRTNGALSMGYGSENLGTTQPADISWAGLGYFGVISSNAPQIAWLNAQLQTDDTGEIGTQVGGTINLATHIGYFYLQEYEGYGAGPASFVGLDTTLGKNSSVITATIDTNSYASTWTMASGSEAGTASSKLEFKTNSVVIFLVNSNGLATASGYKDNSIAQGSTVVAGASGRLQAASAFTGNWTVLTNGANTATFHITNGIIYSITAP